MICKRKIGFILFLTCAAAVGFLQPFRGLAPQSHMVMAVTLISLGAWIFKGKNTPYTAGAVVFIAGCLTCRLPLATLTSAYTGSAIWILIPALFFGFALLKTGLGTRIAYFVLQALRPGYFMICLGWLIIGLVLSAMTPSITVRLSIVLPIAMSLVRACNIPEKSNASALISFSAWAAALLPGIAWQTGSLWGIIIPGFYPPEMRSFASPGTWFQYMSVPWFSITLIFLALIYLFFRPGTGLVIDPKIIKEKYRSLGRIKVDEIVCCCVLVCSLILFSTEKWTGIPSLVTALGAFAVLMGCGIIKVEDVSRGINWDIVNFIAIAMSLTSVFSLTGISAWAGSFVQGYMLDLAARPLDFLLVTTVALFAIRFVDVPWGYTTIALFSSLLPPLFSVRCLHPVLVSVALIAAGNSFFLSYQQPFVMIGDSLMGSGGWTERHVVIGGCLYAASVLIGIFLSFFYWRAAGLLP